MHERNENFERVERNERVESDSISQTLQRQQLIPLSQAVDLFPVKPSYPTVHRWAMDGVQIGERRVKLQTAMSGPRAYTCAAWVEEFQAACAAARGESEEGHNAQDNHRFEASQVAEDNQSQVASHQSRDNHQAGASQKRRDNHTAEASHFAEGNQE